MPTNMKENGFETMIVNYLVADLPEIVRQDERYQNAMMYSDRQNARDESDRATTEAILKTMGSGIELYKAVKGNESFRKWILEMVFNATYITPETAKTKKRKTVNYADAMSTASTLMVAETPAPYGKKIE